MRKISNKAMIALLSATLVLGLTGCGSQQTAAPKEEPKTTQTEKAPEAQKPSETPKPAETAKPTTAPAAPAIEEEDCGC